MAEKSTFIKIDRNITEWGWYQDANTFRVFMHLLIRASFKEKEYAGIVLKRGDYITTYERLATELKLSVRQVRTSLTHLKKTGEVTITRHPEFQVISIKNYDFYQSDYEKRQSDDSQSTVKSQSDDKQLTVKSQSDDSQPTIKQERKEGKERNERKELKERKENSGETPEPPVFESTASEKNKKLSCQLQEMVENYTQNPELQIALSDFIQYRKKSKSNFSVKALQLNLDKLDTLAFNDKTKIEIVNQSIEYGWSGLYPLKQNNQYGYGRRRPVHDIIREQEMEDIHKYLELLD